jgi:hypothetical protein
MKIINASIDLNKIDRTKIVAGKNGAKYYNVGIIVSDEKNQYGQDVSIYDEQSKEEREERKPKKYLGNGKVVWSNDTDKKVVDVPDEAQAKSKRIQEDEFSPF